MPKHIAETWLKASATSAAEKDHETHMNLISRQVSLTGVPGFETINFDAWSSQCKHEFENDLIKDVGYKGLKILVATDTRIMFKTLETVEATDGTTNTHGIEVMLEKEDDGQWRLKQERVLPDDESRHDGLI